MDRGIESSLQSNWYPFPGLGDKVSPIGLGTVKFGRNQKVKNKSADGFELPTDVEVANLLDLATDLGINFIDTAPGYGKSEDVLGRSLEGRRQKYFISSKVGEEFNGEDSTYDFSAKHTRMSIERSLKRLRTDYLDSILVHCPREDLEVLQNSEVLEELQRMKTQGKIRSFGASTNSIEGGLFAVKHTDSVMVSFNAEYRAELEVIQAALDTKIGILIKKGLLQGHLDKISSKNPVFDCMNAIYSISKEVSVILGTLNPKHLRQNVHAAVEALAH